MQGKPSVAISVPEVSERSSGPRGLRAVVSTCMQGRPSVAISVPEVSERSSGPRGLRRVCAASEQLDERRDAALFTDRVAIDRRSERDGAQCVCRLGRHGRFLRGE